MKPVEDMRGKPVAWARSATGLYHIYCTDWLEGDSLVSACGKARAGAVDKFESSVPARETCGACRLWVTQVDELHGKLVQQEYAERRAEKERQEDEERHKAYRARTQKALVTKRRKKKRCEELGLTREQLSELEARERAEERRARRHWWAELRQRSYRGELQAEPEAAGDCKFVQEERIDLLEHGFEQQCMLCGCRLYLDTEICVCETCADERFRGDAGDAAGEELGEEGVEE